MDMLPHWQLVPRSRTAFADDDVDFEASSRFRLDKVRTDDDEDDAESLDDDVELPDETPEEERAS